jgi:hypothetical protein
MNVEIPEPSQYFLRLVPTEDASHEDALRIRKEPNYILPTLPHAGLKIDGRFEDYEVVDVWVDPPVHGEDPRRFIDVKLEVRVIP